MAKLWVMVLVGMLVLTACAGSVQARAGVAVPGATLPAAKPRFQFIEFYSPM